jgi:hypothetical protein
MTTVGMVGMVCPSSLVEMATNETRVVVDFKAAEQT